MEFNQIQDSHLLGYYRGHGEYSQVWSGQVITKAVEEGRGLTELTGNLTKFGAVTQSGFA